MSTMAKRLPLLGNAGAADSSECSDVKLDRLEEARRTNGLLSWKKYLKKERLVIKKIEKYEIPLFLEKKSLSKFNFVVTKKSEKAIKGNICRENMTQDCITQDLTQKQILVNG